MVRSLIVPAMCLAMLAGCGSAARDVAKNVIVRAAQAGDVVDVELSRAYARAAIDALDAAQTLSEYHGLMSGWDGAASALEAFRHTLTAAWYLIDGSGAGEEDEYTSAAACVYLAMVDLSRALAAVGVPIPDQLADAIQIGAVFAGQACTSTIDAGAK